MLLPLRRYRVDHLKLLMVALICSWLCYDVVTGTGPRGCENDLFQ